MSETVFPYPGGKSRFASWILDYVPEHTCFVEVFGGAAGVLVNKNPETSDVEVYNDRDGDLVQFFEVLREHPDELVTYLDDVPYAREVYETWVERFYHGYRPEDDVARAGQFFALRYFQWGGGYAGPNGFATGKQRSRATSFRNKIDRLERFADRFDDVVIEHRDWQALLEQYDSPETVFYLDPPYAGQQEYYPIGNVDHEALADTIQDFTGEWLLSCEHVPATLQDYPTTSRAEHRFIGSGENGGAKSAHERLVLSTGCTTEEV